MNVYLVSHNGMGDNIFMNGSINFLLKYYDKIFFLCKKKYYDNINLFFFNNENVTCVPFDENHEFNEIKNILEKAKVENDILVCGFHKTYINNKITNPRFINSIYNIEDKNYTIDFDTLTSSGYSFIESFYKDIHLNLTIFYEYFSIESSHESSELYNSIKNYKKIIFIQLYSSCGRQLNISNILTNNLHDKESIIICNDKNLYDIDSDDDDVKNKKTICDGFVMKKITYYIDVIKNSNEIYLIDSCFIGIILPLMKQNKLKADKIRIIRRELVDSIEL
jgi:hypothetical protein